jgi:hypothetical protein
MDMLLLGETMLRSDDDAEATTAGAGWPSCTDSPGSTRTGWPLIG